MLTALILHRVEITQPGQLVFFEINMPTDAIAVIGIETGVSGFYSAVDIADNWIASDLRIQSPGVANQCFSSEVALGVSRLERQITGFPGAPIGQLTSLWTEPYSGGKFVEPALLGLEHCTELYGCYKDCIGSILAAPIGYTVNIYIWYYRK